MRSRCTFSFAFSGEICRSLRRNIGQLALGCSVVAALCGCDCYLRAQEVPELHQKGKAAHLELHGKPFLILGGELGNSSATTVMQADEILPRLAAAHVNTVLLPATWEQIEPDEGKFDFVLLDHWIDVARAQKLHLVLLWFGAWKNSVSSYSPAWVKRDPSRFPRVIGEDGQPIEILSPLSRKTLDADSRAFRMLMRHLKKIDAEQQTVLMVQVENEVGNLGSGRDRSAEADQAFSSNVPAELARNLQAHPNRLSPELLASWNPGGHTWADTFGDRAPEAFSAWNYARYIGQVAAAGKQEYALPMFVNAQLPSPFERAGEYPSGGPHPYFLELYRVAAPALDFFSPDIYWPDFEYWCQRYKRNENPLFIPEARLETSQWNALYAYGEALAFGFSPFSIDSSFVEEGLERNPKNSIATLYGLLDQLKDAIPKAQDEGRIHAMVLHSNSPRPTQTVSLGGYLFQGSLARSWPTKNLLQNDGATLVLELAPDDYIVLGTAMSLTIRKDLDAGPGTVGFLRVEDGQFVHGTWTTQHVLNGDQTNQGRDIFLPAHNFTMLRIQTYTIR